MAKLNVQQVGILIITAVMVIGTLGSFAVMILANKNEQQDAAKLQKVSDEYEKTTNEYNSKVEAQAKELSKKYYSTLSQFKDYPKKYNRDTITKLATQDLIVGKGKAINKDSSFSAYYILWGPDGTTLESSIDGKTLNSPLAVNKLSEASLIEGWKEGFIGMNIGGVRLLEIPSDKAYGEPGNGDSIGPNTPLKFIVMAIDKVEEIPAPAVPQELMRGY